MNNHIIIIEFKFAKASAEIAKIQKQGKEQVAKYAETYKNQNKQLFIFFLFTNKKIFTIIIIYLLFWIKNK